MEKPADKPAKRHKKDQKLLVESVKSISKAEKTKRVEALELSRKLTPKPEEMLSPDGKMVLSEIDIDAKDESLRDPFAEKCDLLKTEWGFYGGELEPEVWLEGIKGYSKIQSKKIVSFEGYDAWVSKRIYFQNQALEKFTQRSVDIFAEFQDFCAKGAKLSLVRAMESLQNPVKKIDSTTGKWTPGLSTMDIKNCADAINQTQTVMMRAMGIHPKEEVGVKIIYEQLKTIQVSQMRDSTAGATSTTFDEDGKEVMVSTSDDPRLMTMTNEEMWAMIEILREQQRKAKADQGG